jgi:hypothetical protein
LSKLRQSAKLVDEISRVNMPLIKLGDSGWLQPCMEILDYGVSDVSNALAYYDMELIAAVGPGTCALKLLMVVIVAVS